MIRFKSKENLLLLVFKIFVILVYDKYPKTHLSLPYQY